MIPEMTAKSMNFFCRYLTVLWMVAGITLKTECQEATEPSNIRFGVISSQQGLSQSSVFSLAQDHHGFIWIGTRDGLDRFDGYNFVTYRIDPQDTSSISNNEITVIHADRNGDIWVGTRGGGLNKYMTRSNRFMRFSHLTPEQIIRDIYESPDGWLWVGSSDGLLKADISDKTNPVLFTNVSRKSIYLDENGQLLPHQKIIVSVVSINQLSKDTILVGTELGMFHYLPSKNQFVRVNVGDANAFIVTSILITKDTTIWIGSFNGLIKAVRDDRCPGRYRLTTYSQRGHDQYRLYSNRIESLVEDSYGNVWAGTRGGGLVRIEKSGTLTHFRNDENDINSIRDNIVNSLLIDNAGVLWIGTESQGCNTLDLFSKKFMHIRSIPNNPNSLGGALVTAITGAGGNTVWVGSAVKGLDKLIFDEQGNYTISHIRTLPVVNTGEITSEVISLLSDRNNEVWIGNATNSLIRYSERHGFMSYLTEGFVFSLLEDHEGRIWYGTWGQGLGWFDKKTNQLNRIENSPNTTRSLSSDKIIALYEDNSQNLWVGTKGGGVNVIPLRMINEGNSDFVTYRHSLKDAKSLSHDDVYCILQDHHRQIWIGTGSGLNKVEWDQEQSLTEALLKGEITCKSYLEKDGLSNGVVYGILEDRRGNLWLSTNNGLSMFDPPSEKFINYNVNDGLQANEFYANAYFEDRKGHMYFGGVNGLTLFDPDSIIQKPISTKVVLTGLKIFNKIVQPGESIRNRVILKDAIYNTDKINLSYKDKELTLEFSALYYANPQRIRYQYRLLGFNDEWRQSDGSSRTVTYTNLDDGDYTFQVRATSDYGISTGPVTELILSMKPPYWRKPWFFLVYVIVIVAGLIVFRKYSLIAVTEKNKLLIERLEHKKIIEMTEAKMRFLTNISHEIRTPLTLISDPLDVVLTEGTMDNESQRSLKLISKNVHRLLGLANQLLQLQKIDLGILQPKMIQVDLISFLKDVLIYFEQHATRRNIHLTFHTEMQEILINFDPELMTTVFYNLLANSFKYTADDGTVGVRVYRHEGPLQRSIYKGLKRRIRRRRDNRFFIAVEITDTGRGIPEHDLKNIFRRFYQVHEPGTNHNSGSGIGLSLVKEYIDIHKGHIEVNSNLRGSRFIVYMPVDNRLTSGITKTILSDAPAEPVSTAPYIEAFSGDEPNPETERIERERSGVGDSRILIIEDDHELADYLVEFFSKKYRVTIAYNGKKGLKMARDEMPELIISDVMLPEMSGLQLCDALKASPETGHIPIVLITAQATEENINEGYQHGADLYITKPFSIKVLDAQVKMLIESRSLLRNRYSRQIMLKPSDVTITPLDEKFLKQLLHVTEMNIANSEFDVTGLVEAMHMSHTTILRKVKSLTGISLVEFIKNHRIKKAALILQKEKLPISEVSYMVGFTDPKYFSKCFVKEYGMTPTVYIAAFHTGKKHVK
jgi:signal transduction histidine kinase/ligand-binding sensor domain-containing protein/DNA-binding response OmpR family regulator